MHQRNFNSHAHVERDSTRKHTHLRTKISTHTLTWSVTVQLLDIWDILFISTHTLTWSVTGSVPRPCIYWYNFNSHAHVERDTIIYCIDYTFLNFNSHAHVERDKNQNLQRVVFPISTHTLTWSVTCSVISFTDCWYFNSHAHVERDVAMVHWPLGWSNFNSHAHVERDCVTSSILVM